MFLIWLIIFWVGSIFLGFYVKKNFVTRILVLLVSAGLVIASINVGLETGKTLAINAYSRSLAGIIYELDKSVKKNDIEELKNKISIIISNLQNSNYNASVLQKVDYMLEEMYSLKEEEP